MSDIDKVWVESGKPRWVCRRADGRKFYTYAQYETDARKNFLEAGINFEFIQLDDEPWETSIQESWNGSRPG